MSEVPDSLCQKNTTEELALLRQIHSASYIQTRKIFQLLQCYLQSAIAADRVTWLAAYRGALPKNSWQVNVLKGWKVVDLIFPKGVDRQPKEVIEEYRKLSSQKGIDPMTSLAIESAGQTRVHRCVDSIPQKEWAGSWINEKLSSDGIAERMLGVYTLSDYAESYLIVDRESGNSGFSDADALNLYQLLHKTPRLHYLLFLE